MLQYAIVYIFLTKQSRDISKIIQDLQYACLRFGKLLSQSVSSHKAFYAISSKIPARILTPGWIGEQKYQQIYIFFIITLGQTFETNIH